VRKAQPVQEGRDWPRRGLRASHQWVEDKHLSGLSGTALGEKLDDRRIVPLQTRAALVFLSGELDRKARSRPQGIVAQIIEEEIPLIDIPKSPFGLIVIELATISGDEIKSADFGAQLLSCSDRMLDNLVKSEPSVKAIPEGKEGRAGRDPRSGDRACGKRRGSSPDRFRYPECRLASGDWSPRCRASFQARAIQRSYSVYFMSWSSLRLCACCAWPRRENCSNAERSRSSNKN